MSLIVQKFGGTSVADIPCINNVANKVQKELALDNQVIIVLSAMSGTTNKLVNLVNEAMPPKDADSFAEYDTIISTGEQISAGLLALILQSRGIKSRSFSGWQLPINTNQIHGKARIDNIEITKVKELLKIGGVAVITGFQGISNGRITTLGRGGSDISAVAIAAAFKADRCDIYTDVDGVYSCDPHIVKTAHKIDFISYEEMLEMASQGAKVLQTRSVEMAMKHSVRLRVLSSFDDKMDNDKMDNIGTILVKEEEILEKERITGIAYNRDEARITLRGVPDKPGISADLFGILADSNINVDMIVQNVTPDGDATDVTFTLSKNDADEALKLLEHIKCTRMRANKAVAKVSIIGVGMRSNAGVARDMFKVLAKKNINILVIATSEIKVSVLIEEDYLELALRSLHTAYGLDAIIEEG